MLVTLYVRGQEASSNSEANAAVLNYIFLFRNIGNYTLHLDFVKLLVKLK